MSEATSKGGLSRFSVSRSSKQTDRKLLINNDQGVLRNQTYKLHNKAIRVKGLHFLQKNRNKQYLDLHSKYIQLI